ncbi:hypothetical protein ACOSQ3_014833 [Xanthoceras sorbifolium]
MVQSSLSIFHGQISPSMSGALVSRPYCRPIPLDLAPISGCISLHIQFLSHQKLNLTCYTISFFSHPEASSHTPSLSCLNQKLLSHTPSLYSIIHILLSHSSLHKAIMVPFVSRR